MSFDPTLPTLLDRIRFIVMDTDPDNPLLPDETYAAKIDEYEVWKLAAADIAESLAVQIENDVSSFSDPVVGSISFSDRTRSLRGVAARLRSEAAAEASSAVGRIQSIGLTREDAGRRAEYRAAVRLSGRR